MAITDNIQEKVKKAKALGYSDTQIQTYLKSQGVTPPPASGFTSNVKKAFAERVDKASDAQISKQNPASKALQTGGQAAAFVGDLAFEAVKTITPEPVKKAVAKGAQKAVQSAPVQQGMEAYQAWKTKNPEAAANLESVVNIASLFPGVKAVGVTAKAASSATGATVKAAGSATSAAARATKATGKVLYDTGFTPPVREAERILNYEAKNPFLKRAANALTGQETPGKPRLAADTAMEKGIAGTERMIGVQAKRQAAALWNEKIAPAVKGTDAVVTKDELFAPLQRLIEKTAEPGRKKALQEAFEAIQEDYADINDLPLELAQAIKRDLDAFTPAKMFRGKDVVSEYRTLAHEMADAIRQKTYDSLADVNIKKDYLDWANLKALEEVGVKAISEAKLKGGFGGFWSAMWDMTTTPIKTVGGQVLYRVGNVLEFAGDKGLKTFGDFLKKQGFQRSNSSK